jgi:hypothetical protein
MRSCAFNLLETDKWRELSSSLKAQVLLNYMKQFRFTSQNTHCFSITNTYHLVMFKDIISICENITKPIKHSALEKCRLLNAKAAAIHNYKCALELI